MWGSISFGTVAPLVCLVAVLSVTGFSYRIGQTCLPNHEYNISTFSIWLVIFAILAFLLQTFTTGYCFYVYVRSLWRMRRESAADSFERGQVRRELESWGSVRNLFSLQWRDILVSVFVIISSISFFNVFWTQDGKQGNVFNDPNNIQAVNTWIICHMLSMGDKKECRKYVQDFTVDQAAVLVSLLLASASAFLYTIL
jgi:amino acid transporter